MTISPNKQILLAVGILLLALVLFSWLARGTVQGVLLVPLAVLVGPVMALTVHESIYSNGFKLLLALGFVASAGSTYFGYGHKARVWGQAATVAGIAAWTFLGMIGLGTGT